FFKILEFIFCQRVVFVFWVYFMVVGLVFYLVVYVKRCLNRFIIGIIGGLSTVDLWEKRRFVAVKNH
ncbi:hypothetical protein ACVGWB_06885, partial [Enterobacter mori]